MRRLRGPNGPDATQRVRLDGVEYLLRWRWIARASRWALDVRSTGGSLLAGGIRVVSNAPLLASERAARTADTFPPGELIVYDARSTERLSPGLSDLGGDLFPIFYQEAAA